MSSGTKYYETRKMKKYRVKQFRENFGVSDTMPWHTSSPSNRAFQFSLRKRLVYTPTLPKSYNSNSKRNPVIVNVDLIPESSDSLEGSVLGKGLIQNVKDVDLGHAKDAIPPNISNKMDSLLNRIDTMLSRLSNHKKKQIITENDTKEQNK